MAATLQIDGSYGEGGGQILRTSLALSMLTGKPFRIERIRANRDKPGLKRQHLTAVRAAAEVCGATVAGDAIGSGALDFTPGLIRPGEYTFDIGSAGSTTLVLQTILPALLTAGGSSQITLIGGTHNFGAPPIDFLEKAFLPVIRRMGPRVEVALERPGFAPAGGGRLIVLIEPAGRLVPVHIPARGEVRRRAATAVSAGLPRHVADRELAVIAKRLGWSASELRVREFPEAFGPGNALMAEIECDGGTEVLTAFGRRGVSAEAVAEDVAGQAKRFLLAGVPVGEHLADQLLLPFALAGGGSFATLPLSLHARTNIDVIGMFLSVPIATREADANEWIVEVGNAASGNALARQS